VTLVSRPSTVCLRETHRKSMLSKIFSVGERIQETVAVVCGKGVRSLNFEPNFTKIGKQWQGGTEIEKVGCVVSVLYILMYVFIL